MNHSDYNERCRVEFANHLTAKVNGRNIVNQLANEFTPVLLTALQPWVGQKIENVTGGLSKKFKASLPPFPQVQNVDFFVSANGYSLHLTIRHRGSYESRSGGSTACYTEERIYLAEVNGLTLGKLNLGAALLRTNYTTAEVEQARKDLQDAENTVSRLSSAVNLWGRHDNH